MAESNPIKVNARDSNPRTPHDKSAGICEFTGGPPQPRRDGKNFSEVKINISNSTNRKALFHGEIKFDRGEAGHCSFSIVIDGTETSMEKIKSCETANKYNTLSSSCIVDYCTSNEKTQELCAKHPRK